MMNSSSVILQSIAKFGRSLAIETPRLNLATKVNEFIRDSRAPNSRLAYASDLAQFCDWGGALPASPELVAAYLAAHADVLSVATLRRRLTAISHAHRTHSKVNPVATELVKATLRGIARTRARPAGAAKPLLRDNLFSVLDAIGTSASDLRDRALLLIGFAGALRRSEVVGLDFADLTQTGDGVVITLRHSKTDQLNTGQKIGVPFGRERHCPVRALSDWLKVSGIQDGAVFRPMNRHGAILDRRLSSEAVSLIVKRRLAAAGFDPTGFSGHSLRAGFITSAAISGAPIWKIRKQTRHTTDQGVARYIRTDAFFIQNAAEGLL